MNNQLKRIPISTFKYKLGAKSKTKQLITSSELFCVHSFSCLSFVRLFFGANLLVWALNVSNNEKFHWKPFQPSHRIQYWLCVLFVVFLSVGTKFMSHNTNIERVLCALFYNWTRKFCKFIFSSQTQFCAT